MTTPTAQTTPTAPGGREPIPPPTGGAPPGAPPEGAPFQSALDAEWARTATAEGQQQSHSASSSPTASRNTPVHRVRGAGADASSTAAVPLCPPGTTVAVAGAGGTRSAVTPPAVNDRATNVTATNVTAANGPAANNPATNLAADTPDTPAVRDAGDGAASPAAATDLEGSSTDAKGADAVPGIHTSAPPVGDPTPTGGASTPTAGSPPLPASVGSAASQMSHASSTSQAKASPPLLRAPAAGATLSSATRTEGAGAGGTGSWSSQAGAHRPAEQQGPRSAGDTGAHDKLWVPDAAQAAPGADAGGGGVGTGGAGGLAEGSGSVQLSAAPSGEEPELGQGPLLDYGVSLQQAIETLHGTIQLAARQGLAQARIALEPEGLGEIRIHLTQTAQGLLARVTAETPAAAQALAAAHAELRQSLSSLGLDLARLSVGRHGHAAAQDGGTALGGGGRDGSAGSGEASSRGARSGQTTATEAPTTPAPDSEAQEDAQLAPAPTRGTLVDVLA
jgi:flagellar hook-length control protein FliK